MADSNAGFVYSVVELSNAIKWKDYKYIPGKGETFDKHKNEFKDTYFEWVDIIKQNDHNRIINITVRSNGYIAFTFPRGLFVGPTHKSRSGKIYKVQKLRKGKDRIILGTKSISDIKNIFDDIYTKL